MEGNKKIREAILAAVCHLDDEELNKVAVEGTWSIAQILEHLYLMESLIAKVLEDALQKETFDDPGNFPIHLVSDRSMKVRAPEKLAPSSAAQSLQDLEGKLSRSRSQLEHLETLFSEEELNRKTASHPRFGMLTLKQWIRLVGYHEQRHYDQIEEVKLALTKLDNKTT